ncbi:PAS domain S-box protein [candidate division WOR-3 bacterium]|nr:PAS domain S-box protein [candidate division WOR-3 bacterium]
MPLSEIFENDVLECLEKILLIVDTKGNIVSHSENLEKFSGKCSKNTSKTNIFEFIHADDRAKAEEIFENILSKPRESFPFDLRIVLENSTDKYVSGRAKDMRENRKFKGIIIAFSDVSEDKLKKDLQRVAFAISDLMIHKDELEDLFNKIHFSIKDLIPSENFFLAVYEKERNALSFPCYIDLYDSRPEPRPVKNSLTDYVVKKGIPLLLTEPEIGDFLCQNGLEIQGTSAFSWLGVPLKYEDEVIGALVVQSYDKNLSYGSFHKNILEFVSNNISAALAKKQRMIKELEYKQFLEKIIDNIPISLYAKDKKGNFLMWNKASENFYGLKSEDVVGKNDFDFFPREQAEFFQKMDEKTLRNNTVYDIPEEPIDSPKSGRRLLHTIKMPVTDEKGKPSILLGLSDDITEKKINENILKLQHKLAVKTSKTNDLSEALNYILYIYIEFIEEVDSGGVYLTDQDTGGLTLAAHSGLKDSLVKKIERYEKDSPKGIIARKQKPSFFPQKELVEKDFSAVLNEGIKSLAVIPIFYKDSPVACMNLASHTYENFSEISIKILSQIAPFLGDIITRIQNDLKIRLSESKFRSTFENAPVGMSIMDPEGRYIAVNRSLCNILEYTEPELLKMKFTDLTYPDDLYKSMRYLNSLTAGEKNNVQFEKRFYNKSGRVIWTLLNSFALRGEENIKIITHILDITERKQIEDQLSKMKSLESLGFLAGGIAHDFNNILTTISGNISMANIYTPDEGDLKESLREAEKGIKKATDLTQQLLTFAKGGIPFKEASSIPEIIKSSASFILRGKDISVEYNFDKDLWVVDIDKGQFSQVIQNLVLNSVQAMPGGGKIVISSCNISLSKEQIEKYKYLYYLKPGKFVEITIRDTGIGIPQDDIMRIFNPYFTTKENGSGLGLSIVYSIIKNHNGIIETESEIKKGTTFKIIIPASEKPHVSQNHEKSKKIKRGRANILLMDDEEMVIKVTSKMLEELGYKTDTARNGEEVLDKLRKSPYDLVILDLTVQNGMGGKETIKEIRKSNPSVKALVSSGYSNDLTISQYREYGFDNYLIKPFTLNDLSEKIIETLEI